MIRIGPAALVTAAFIGPGTVATCFLAGADFGYDLLWALVFATCAAIVLQEMAARLGAGARLGLGEALFQGTERRLIRLLVGALLVTALAIGNAAYEGGNLAGGALGAGALFGKANADRVAVPVLAVAAGAALATGSYRILERVLIALVVVMSVAFLLAASLAGIDAASIIRGLRPQLPTGGLLTVLALVGTTIVPYNLFLHAAAARERFKGQAGVRAARLDTVVAVGLGGIVSCAILTGAAASGLPGGTEPNIALALEPTLGPGGRIILGAGLLAAGLTSAITAPMATGFVVVEILAPPKGRRRQIFRIASFAVLLTGAALASLGIRPTALILVAQAANGLLLPVAATYLLLVMNQRNRLGAFANGLVPNITGAAVVGVTLVLGCLGLLRAIGAAS